MPVESADVEAGGLASTIICGADVIASRRKTLNDTVETNNIEKRLYSLDKWINRMSVLTIKVVSLLFHFGNIVDSKP